MVENTSRFGGSWFLGCSLLCLFGSGCSSGVGPAVISLNPLNPYHFDQLEVKLEVDAVGRNGEPLTDLENAHQYEITWYVNNEQIDKSIPIIAPPEDYKRGSYRDDYEDLDWTINDGETWRVVVTPRDRGVFGPSSSAEVTVNSRPTVAPVLTGPGPEGDSSVDLVLEPNEADADEEDLEGEPTPSYLVTWRKNHTEIVEKDVTNLTIRHEDIAKTDLWEAVVTPYTELGGGREQDRAYGPTVTVNQQMYNQPPFLPGDPEVLAVTTKDNDTDETTIAGADTVVCAFDKEDVDDTLDTVTPTVEWWYESGAITGPVLQGVTDDVEHTLTGAGLGVGDKLWCEVFLTDDTEDGVPKSSLPRTIVNTAPEVLSAVIDNTTNVDNVLGTISVGDTVNCTVDASDYDDLEAPTIEYVWERVSDGVEVGAGANPLELDPNGGFFVGDKLVCKATPTDSDGKPGYEVTSDFVLLEGTPNYLPEVNNVSVQPNPATAGADLQCTYDWVDEDLNEDDEPRDPDLSQFEWTVNGTVVEDAKWVDIDVKMGRACGIDETGQVRCWGQGLDHGDVTVDPTGEEIYAKLPKTVQFAQISLGFDHDCGVSVSGELHCWGREDFGLKDDGQVRNVPSGTFTTVASGSGYACALTEAGAVTCWGNNDYTQVSSTPQADGFTLLVAGPDTACAVDADDTIDCWGLQGDEFDTMTAVNDYDDGHQLIDLEWDALCMLDDDFSPYCWDYSSDFTAIEMYVPNFVSGYKDLSVGLHHACAVTKKDKINCWGEEDAAAGFGYISDAPQDSGYVAVAVGAYESCAIHENGEIICWGSMPVGWDDSVITEAPVGLSPTGPMLFGGAEFDEEVSCTVTPFDGLGHGEAGTSDPVTVTNTRPSAADVAIEPATPGHGEDLVCTSTLSDDEETFVGGEYLWTANGAEIEGPGWTQVSAGSQHSCGLDEVGQVVCWGDESKPAVSHGLTGVGYTAVAAGFDDYTCAIHADGAILCDGEGDSKAIVNWPPETGEFTQLSIAFRAACALDSEGRIACWGGDKKNGYDPQSNTLSGISTYVEVVTNAPEDSGYISVSVGEYLACAVDSAGMLECWGDETDDKFPGEDQMPSDSGYTVVAVGTQHACALNEAGEISCWGHDGDGQVSDVAGLNQGYAPFVALDVGADRSCVIDDTGKVHCWGQEAYFIISDAATLPGRHENISVGKYHACVVSNQARVDCWGLDNGDLSLNDFGQVTEAPTGSSTWGETLTSEYTEFEEEITCTVTPYDSIAYGDPLTSDPVTVLNALPSVSNVEVTPDPGSVSAALECTYDWHDDDGDLDQSYITWKVDGEDADDSDGDPLTLDGGYGEGETVKCFVTPYDGLQEGEEKKDAVDINWIPTVENVKVTPERPTKNTVELTCEYDFDDKDGDGDSSSFSWYGSTSTGEIGDEEKLVLTDPDEGQAFTCEVTPIDGLDSGTVVSTSVTINHAPEVSDVTITPASPTVDDTLECTYTFDDNDNHDAEAGSLIEWFVNGSSAGTGASLSSGYAGGDEVTCTVTPNDGIESGDSQINSVTIANSPPEVSGITILATTDLDGDGDNTTAGTNDTLECSWTFSDADGDSDASTIQWTDSGSILGTEPTLSGEFHRDDEIECVVTPNDGADSGSNEEVAITIGNTLPTVLSVDLTSSTDEDGDGDSRTAIATDILECAWTVDDADGDAVSSTAEFFNGATSVGAGVPGSSANLLGGFFVKGETISCTVTPSDGDPGPVSTSDPLVIANAVPSVSGVRVISTTDEDGDGYELTAGAADTLECSYTFSDVDADGDASTVDWFVNGSIAGSGTTLSGAFTDGDAVSCTVTPNDGEDAGVPVAAADLSIAGWVYVEVAAGSTFSCALTTLGEVHCWGLDATGEVWGEPTSGSYMGLSAGDDFACALTTGGDAECWGSNTQGQSTPVAEVFESISAGGEHACGLMTTGEVKCWGSDGDGQVTGVPVADFDSVSAGGYHTCGVTSTGAVECWGDDLDGQVSSVPADPFASLGLGNYHSCGVTLAGDVECWGFDGSGQVSSAPVVSFETVSGGKDHNCGVTLAGDVECWGNDLYYQVSDTPTGTFTSVSAGTYHACGVTSAGAVECWGDNDSYQLNAPCPSDADCDGLVTVLDCDDGDAGNLYTTDDCDGDGVPGEQDCDDTDAGNTLTDDCDQDGEPTATDCDDTNPSAQLTTNDADCDGFATTVDCDDGDPNSTYECIELSAGGYHTCVIDGAGALSCWGGGEVVGLCDQTDVDCGQSIPPAGTFQDVSGAGVHSCGVLDDGSVQCWGADNSGVFDWGQVSSTPTTGDFSSVATGTYHSCAVSVSTGAVECWGAGETASDCEITMSPYECGQSMPPTGSFDSVSGGFAHTCGLKTDGTVECWGDNSFDQSSPPSHTFVQVSAGWLHTCGIDSSGEIECWGLDSTGQAVAPVGSFTSLSAGAHHTCAIDSGGYLQCWGAGTTSASSCSGYHCGQSTPPAGSNYVRVSAGDWHTCALTDEASVVCWGDASFGQSEPWCLDDEDCDGLRSAEDCDDADSSSNALADDGDCDGVLTADDCDDGDPASTIVADDGDCDGVLTTVDCDDTDPARGLCTGELVVSAGAYHTCAINSSSIVQCWGDDTDLQTSNVPVGIGYFMLRAGGYHTCALTYAGELSCWGDDTQGQVTGMPTSGDFVDLASGEDHSCGLDSAGLITCWGLDDWGQVSGPNSSATLYSQVTAGASHTCAINASDGTAECWGIDDGSAEDYAQVTDTPLAETFTTLSAGVHFTCGVTASSSLDCWGIDGVANSLDTAGQFLDFGQVWDAPTSGTFSSVSGGFFHACAIDGTDDTVQCWGITDISESDFGQVSDASTDNFTSLSSGLFHTCGVTTANTVSCWGSDSFGQSIVPGL